MEKEECAANMTGEVIQEMRIQEVKYMVAEGWH